MAMGYVRTRLGRLFYEERGAQRRSGDPAIVLLHGLLFDGGMWRGQVEPLAALGRVVILDEHADALLDAFGELGIHRAVVVGLSWGGMVAMRLALQHPGKVAGLALLDASADAEPLAQRVKFRAFIAMHRRIGFPFSLFQRELAPLMFGPRVRVESPELIDAAYRRMMSFDRAGLSRAAIAVVVHRKKILPDLPRINTPTLVICGREDRSTPPEQSEAIAKGIPRARLEIIEGAGHMSALEDPAAVNAHLVPFVRGCVENAG